MTIVQMDASVNRADAMLKKAVKDYYEALVSNPHSPVLGSNPNSPAISGEDRTKAYMDATLVKLSFDEMKQKALAAEAKQLAIYDEVDRRYNAGEFDIYRRNAELIPAKNLLMLAKAYYRLLPVYVSLYNELCRVAADYYNLASDVLRGKERVVV